MTDEQFEYRCAIVLPPGERHPAMVVLNLMALAVRNRDHDGPPQSNQPPVFHWNTLSRVYTPHDFSTCTPNGEPLEQATGQLKDTSTAGEKLLIWDDRAERIKSSLLKELYQSARNRQLNLWSLFGDTVKEPPDDSADINFWITTSDIYRSDLIKFGQSQKIKADIEHDTSHSAEHPAPDQRTDESRKAPSQGEGRPPHWADYEELARAFPAVEKTDSLTLSKFKQYSSDHNDSPGFREAYIEGTGGRGRGNRSQFDIFAFAKYLLKRRFLTPASVVAGLRMHLGAALKAYKDEYDDMFSSSTK